MTNSRNPGEEKVDAMAMLNPMMTAVAVWLKMLWPLLLALVVLKALMVLTRSRRFKGKRGERIVSQRLRKGLSEDVYRIIDDVYLPLDDGSTTQIDHIVVSRYGVFVVETKNYTGWIFADAKSRVWTQSIYRRKSKFQNPIRQNYLHICTISQRLGIPMEMLHGVVAFTGDCRFKTEMPNGVVFSRKLADYIKTFSKRVLAESEVADIASAIHEWNETVTSAQRRSHIKNLKSRHRGR